MFTLIGLWIFRLFLMWWYAGWESILFETAEFFFNAFIIWLYSFVIITEITDWFNFSTDSTYVFIGFVCILQMCLMKIIVHKINKTRPVKDFEAIRLVKDLLEICKKKNKSTLGIVFNFVCRHKQTCTKVKCLCHEIIEDFQKDDTSILAVNKNAYITNNEVHPIYRNGFFIKSLKLICDELGATFNGSDELSMCLAELSFYYLGNHYNALAKLGIIQERNPGLFIRQRIYNLKNNISSGLNLTYEQVQDREKTVITIDYLKSYRKFIDESENLIELTIKFWSILIKDQPLAQDLNAIGAKLFESKQKLMKIVSGLNKSAVNHTEFLLRYGLLLRTAMHDYAGAEQTFHRLYYMNTLRQSYTETSKFSIFNTRSKVMFMLVSFTNEADANIIQVNTELEQGIGYKYDEIVGRSIGILMPPVIASAHSKYMQKFFHTMVSQTIGVEQFTFIKCKSGLYLPCRILKRMVPRMNNSLQAAVFLIKDPRIHKYTNSKKIETDLNVGAILCDASKHIIGITKEIMNILKLSDQNVTDLARNCLLEDLFPHIGTNYVKFQASDDQGCVINYKGYRDGADNNITNQLNDDFLKLAVSDSTMKTDSLLWIKFVEEKYADSDKLCFLLVVEVKQKAYKGLLPIIGKELIYEFHASNFTESEYLGKASLETNENKPDEKINNIDINGSEHLLQENESLTGTSESNGTKSNTQECANKYMQTAELTRTTPGSIKRLTLGIILVLIVTITLICIFL